MPRLLKTALVLLIFATTFAFALTGFTLLNIDNEEVAIGEDSVAVAFLPKMPERVNAGETVFNKNCKSCHRLDAKLIGPGIRSVYSTRDSVWLRSWIMNSTKMIASGDPTAVTLFEEYNHTQMPSFELLSKEDIDVLLVYLKYINNN